MEEDMQAMDLKIKMCGRQATISLKIKDKLRGLIRK